LKGWLRESMCQAAIRILRATAALAALLWRERRRVELVPGVRFAPGLLGGLDRGPAEQA
jgi:hypothetical protein